jgi:hypothetical protein
MARLSDALNPDVWIAHSRRLLEFRVPVDTAEDRRRTKRILSGDPELAAHLGRWLGKVGELGDEDEVVGNVITEERLRALWEETRERR